MTSAASGSTLTRRNLLIAGGVGAGLLIGWTVWPRDFRVRPPTAEGESAFNAWLKIGEEGQVTVVVPQTELGQGAYTGVAQMVADELGADWRTVGVEPALPNALQANLLLARESGIWLAEERARRGAAVVTGGSSTVRALEMTARRAGAEARDRLRRAAAERWGVDWRTTEVRDGFVLSNNLRARFGELAAAAAALPEMEEPEIWWARADRLTGRSLPRLDAPAKVDGQASFATDIRLPDMVHASVRVGPAGTARTLGLNRAAALRVPDVLAVVEQGDWVAVAARTWWAADRGAQALEPRWEVADQLSQAALDGALAEAVGGDDWSRGGGPGGVEELWSRPDVVRAVYVVAPRLHLQPEPMSAAADVTETRAQVWAGSQTPAALAARLGEALGLAADAVTVFPTLVGGSFGRRATNEAAVQAAVVSRELGRPVQLTWSRAEDIRHDRVGAPAHVAVAAREGPGGALTGWAARVAVARGPREGAGWGQVDGAKLLDREAPDPARTGIGLAYPLDDWSLEVAEVETTLPTGPWRGGGAVPLVFAAESFADELAARAGIDPFSWRIEKLGSDPRLAACLTTVAELGGWTGGRAGVGQGLAVSHVMGARVAVLAQVHAVGGRIVLDRLTCALDAGRLVNLDMVRQQVEGQLLFAASAALETRPVLDHGVLAPASLLAQAPLRTAATPELRVALMPRSEEPGGVGSVVTPAVAPAIANAIAAATGRRLRALPLSLDTAHAAPT